MLSEYKLKFEESLGHTETLPRRIPQLAYRGRGFKPGKVVLATGKGGAR
jgi:hypothetical protein